MYPTEIVFSIWLVWLTRDKKCWFVAEVVWLFLLILSYLYACLLVDLYVLVMCTCMFV
jgi:hypothetical protein